MAKHPPFVIPAGVTLTSTDRGMSVEHLGDIVLDKPLGDRMNRIASIEGSVTLRGRFEVDRVEAPRGTVRIEGNATAMALRGENVELLGARLKVSSVRASKQIAVGPCRIEADVIVAPRIDIDARASGRIPIIECRNEPGPNAIKGGFSVAEYDELLGNVASYLAEREVEPLEGGSEEEEKDEEEERSDTIIETCGLDEGDAAGAGDPEDDEPAEEAEGESTDDPDTFTDAAALKVGVATAVPEEALDVQGAQEVAVEEEPSLVEVQVEALSPIESEDLQLPPGARPPADKPLDASRDRIAQVDENFQDIGAEMENDSTHQQLTEILRELRGCYEGDEPPPVLDELAGLAERRQYDEIVARLPQIWNDLVRYHRERGLRIRRQVTTTFNNIMTIVKNAPSVTLGQP